MNFKLLIPVLIFTLIITACTEIIDVDINSAKPQTVVEASIALNVPAKVIISKSIDLDQPNSFVGIENAIVKITNNTGKSEILKETKSGIYSSTTIFGEKGKTYTLSIQNGEESITSLSTIPNLVPIDSFKVEKSIYPGGGGPMGDMPNNFFKIKVKYTDPINEKNYYRILLTVNGISRSESAIFEDRLNNGKQGETTLNLFDSNLKSGDTIGIEMQCIDKNVFEYFKSMGNSAMGPRNSSSPANPYTNLEGILLGFFSAHTVERKEYVLP